MPAPRVYDPEPTLSDEARATLLPATARSALSSREFARDMLDQWRLPMSYEVVLVVNELVTNAIIHSTGSIMLSLDLQADAIRVVVSDDSRAIPRQRQRRQSAAGNRGLALVAAIAVTWGIHDRRGGKVIWADVAIDRARAVYPQGPTA